MAISFDAYTAGGSLTASSPKTFSHTCAADADILFVATINSTGANVTGVTYNGVSMTSVATQLNNPASDAYWIGLWYLINPATGTNTVSISFSAGSSNGAASSFIGADRS